MGFLQGKRALITGIASDRSIASGIAEAMHREGAELAFTYQNDKLKTRVEKAAAEYGSDIVIPLDVADDAQMDAVFAAVAAHWGALDTLVHSIAFCPKEDLHCRVVDTSRAGFGIAMDISVHSFLRMVRRCEPLMPRGGTCMTVSFYGSEKVVEHYNIMGPVKAALESVTRYVAAELGPKGISVHALSPGPLATRAASGIDHFDELLNEAAERAPTNQLATIEDVGAYAAFLASAEAAIVTGGIHMIDGGYHIIG